MAVEQRTEKGEGLVATRCELIYGVSGSGKSTWIIKLLESFAPRKSRLIFADGGLETYTSSGLIDEGLLEVYGFKSHLFPLSTLKRLCLGYWPQDPADPRSKLLPPSGEWPYAMFIVEGMSTAADYLMGNVEGGLAWRAAHYRAVETSEKNKYLDAGLGIEEDGEFIGSNNKSHYGVAQRYLVECIDYTRSLPCWVQWSSHEYFATQLQQFGPDVAGSAMMTKIGGSFGNTIHMQEVATRKERVEGGKKVSLIERQIRAYTRKHYDPTGRIQAPYYANNRMPVELVDRMPEYLYPADPLQFYAILNQAKSERTATRRTHGSI